MIAQELLEAVERQEFLSVVLPPENPRDLMTFARSTCVPPTREGASPEPFHPHEVQRMVLVALSDPRWRRFVIVACTQDGKTWLMILLLCWLACEHREAVIWGGPDMRIAQDTWVAKVRPAIEKSGLGGFLPITGDGSGGGSNPETIQFNGGGLVILLGAGGKNRSGQAGRTARWVIVDEFGKVKRELAGKFDRRADAFDIEGRLVKAGTVEMDENDPLLEAYADSAQGQAAWKCPHCGRFTRFEWEQVSADFSNEMKAEQTARIACARCGVLLTDADRQEALKCGVLLFHGQEADERGVVTGDLPPTRTCGIRWGALDTPRRSLTKLCAEFAMAMMAFERGNSVPLDDFWHDQLARARPREAGEGEDPDLNSLLSRSAASSYQVVQVEGEQYLVPVVPDGVHFITMAIDQSKRRLWWTLRGHDRDGRAWHLGWGRLPLCGDLDEPTPEQRLAGLDRLATLRDRGLPSARGGMVRIALGGVDCAFAPEETLSWVAAHPGWLALHGTGDEQVSRMSRNAGKAVAASPGWYQLRESVGAGGRTDQVLWIDSESVKTELARALRRPIGSTGAALLPLGLTPDDRIVQHLSSEKREATPGGRQAWFKRGRFNDWWDCAYYTQALARYLLDRWPELAQEAPPPVDDARPPPVLGDSWGSGLGAW